MGKHWKTKTSEWHEVKWSMLAQKQEGKKKVVASEVCACPVLGRRPQVALKAIWHPIYRWQKNKPYKDNAMT